MMQQAAPQSTCSVVTPSLPDVGNIGIQIIVRRLLILFGIGLLGILVVYGVNCLFFTVGGF